jgi:segregation and condensation protein B
MSQESQPIDEPPKGEEISLQALTEAFAKAMGMSPIPESEGKAGSAVPHPPPADEIADAEKAPPTVADEASGDHCPISPSSILEAMLFVGNRDHQPLTAAQAAELMRGVAAGEIPGLVDALNRRYAAEGCPYQIVSQRSGYRMTLREDFSKLRDRFYGRVREARLSQAAVDVLSIVAYRQPVTAPQIAELRGKPSSRLLSQLVRRGLLELRRPDDRRSSPEYRTAERFLELFGLQSLEDLPQSEDLD